MLYQTLNNGVEMPMLGYGVFQTPPDQTERCVAEALEVGYRLIDTAQAYGNEEGVGAAVRASGLPREDVFITSKIWVSDMTYERATASIEESLRKLDTDYIDLMLLHQAMGDYPGAYRAMEDAYRAGKLRAIGVSNFLESDLQNILNHCEVKPAVDQLLAHIGNTPFELAAFCENNDILVEAYSPIAHGEADKIGAIVKMAERYDVSVAQLCIRYVLQLGMVALPKTANLEHMRSNADVDFEISAQDMETLRDVERISDYGDSSFFPVFGGKL